MMMMMMIRGERGLVRLRLRLVVLE